MTIAGQPQRAGIYCRLSYAPDGSEEKVDRQEADCRALADRLGWALSEAHVFKDNSRSAWQRGRKRPGWTSLLDAVEAGAVDAILVYHGDRLMRQPHDLERLLAAAESRRIRLASVSGIRDLDSPDDRFILRIEVAQACRESDNTSRRVKRGLAARAAAGLSQAGGYRPFGYGVQTGTRQKTDPVTGETAEVPVYDTTQQVPDEAGYAAEAVERQLAGQSQAAVVRWLNTKCTTTAGNTWTTKTWRDFVMSPRIAGLIEHDGILTEAAWDPIISEETRQDVLALYQRTRETRPYPGRERRYLLSGIAECGGCAQAMRGRPVGGTSKPGRRTRYTHYYCPACKKVSRKCEFVDPYVEGWVLDLLSDPRLEAELQAVMEADAPGIAQEIAELDRRKTTARDQLEHLADHPDVDPALTALALASFDRKILELRGRLAVSVELRLITRMIGITRDEWNDEDIDVRSTVVRILYRVVILPRARTGPGFEPDTVQLERRPLGQPS